MGTPAKLRNRLRANRRQRTGKASETHFRQPPEIADGENPNTGIVFRHVHAALRRSGRRCQEPVKTVDDGADFRLIYVQHPACQGELSPVVLATREGRDTDQRNDDDFSLASAGENGQMGSPHPRSEGRSGGARSARLRTWPIWRLTSRPAETNGVGPIYAVRACIPR